MAIRIGEDGTIISSEGEIPQGQNPIIGEDGSIRLGNQPVEPSYSAPSGMRVPPSSPLENRTAQQPEQVDQADSSSRTVVEGMRPGNPGASARPVSTIEYELQMKKAELASCIRLAPIVVCVAFIVIALAMGTFVPAIVSLVAAVPIFQDIVRYGTVSNAVDRLTEELKDASGGA